VKYSLRHLFIVIGILVMATGSSLADSDSDHVRARLAVESGAIVPLSTILEKVESLYEGSIIEVELEDEEDEGDEDAISGYIYEIKLLTPQGNLLKLKLDASTAELIKVKGHGEKQARKKMEAPEEEQEP
jgi:uncharacterized membrane protein YkoI